VFEKYKLPSKLDVIQIEGQRRKTGKSVGSQGRPHGLDKIWEKRGKIPGERNHLGSLGGVSKSAKRYWGCISEGGR